MADRRIDCHRCKTYDRDALRCRIGKANPTKKHVAMTVAELFGPQALCLHSPHREPLLLRMHEPGRRFTFDDGRPPSSNARVDVEIIEDEV